MTSTEPDAGPRPWYHVGPVVAVADPDDSASESKTADVYLYDVIGGWFGLTADDFVRDVAGLDVDQIELHLNTPGGEVSEGAAIANMLRQHKAQVRVWVDGWAASAGSLIAMAGDEVVMGIGSSMMLHNPSSWAVGDADEMAKAARMLESTADTVASAYAARAGGTVAEWRAVMQQETWYSPEEAVNAKLADRVATDDDKGSATGEKVTPGSRSGFWGMWDSLQSPENFDPDRLSVLNFRYPEGRRQAPPPKVSARKRRAGGPKRDLSAILAKAEQDARALREVARKTTVPDPVAEEPKKGAGMSLARIREVMAALPDNASDEQVREALASAGLPTAPPTEPEPGPTPQPQPNPDPAPQASATLPPGMRLISDSAWQSQQDRVKKLEAREQKREREERDQVIAQAIKDGKFTRVQEAHFKDQWDKNPEGTRSLIASLQKGVALPTNELGYATAADDEETETFAEFEKAMPPHLRLSTNGGRN